MIKAFPPNFSAIANVFPVKGKQGILYAYGHTLYNPSGVPVSPWIAAHEAIHMARQEAQGVEAWWRAYLHQPAFRLDEEALAHRAEWLSFSKEGPQNLKDQARYLDAMSTRLSSPLYGSLVRKGLATGIILGGHVPKTPEA